MKVLIFYPFYYYAMKIYHKDKDYKKANKFYQIAERFCPNHTENLFKIGMCYKKCRNYKEASEYFQKALELDSENEKYKEQLEIARTRDFALFAPTKLWWQEIIALEQEIQQKGESYARCFLLAEDCRQMHHYDKAAKAYKRAIALCEHKENLAQLYYEMGYAYENLADEASLGLAKEAYAQAIELDLELESKRYGIGVFHFAKERWKFANRAFLEKLHSWDSIANASDCKVIDCHNSVSQNLAMTQSQAPDDLLLFKVGESFERLYDWQNAIFYYQESLKLNYQNPQIHFRLGFAQERMGDLKGAVESYTQGVHRNNTLNNYWIYRLGFCLSCLQDFEGAAQVLLNLQTIQSYPLLVGGGGNYTMMNSLKNQSFKQRALYTHYYESLPLCPKTILYESFHRRLMSCNPYAIFKFLLHDERFSDFTHIWVIESNDYIKPEYRRLKNLICVKRGSDLYLRYLASAKYLINNTTFPYYFIRKTGQFYLNTWHGTAMKSLGKHIQTSFLEHSNTQRNFLQTTHIINPNDFMQKVLLEDYEISKIYRGKALLSGYARIDLTLQEANKQRLKEHFGIKEGERVLLYAPTYRGFFGQAEFEYATITKLLNT